MCFHYDPSTGRYNFAVMSAIRPFGVATVAALGAFCSCSRPAGDGPRPARRREPRRQRAWA